MSTICYECHFIGVVRQSSGSFQAVIQHSSGNLLCAQKCFHIPDIVLTFQPITSRLCSCDSSAVLWLFEQFCFFKISEFYGYFMQILRGFYQPHTMQFHDTNRVFQVPTSAYPCCILQNLWKKQLRIMFFDFRSSISTTCLPISKFLPFLQPWFLFGFP